MDYPMMELSLITAFQDFVRFRRHIVCPYEINSLFFYCEFGWVSGSIWISIKGWSPPSGLQESKRHNRFRRKICDCSNQTAFFVSSSTSNNFFHVNADIIVCVILQFVSRRSISFSSCEPNIVCYIISTAIFWVLRRKMKSASVLLFVLACQNALKKKRVFAAHFTGEN